MKSRALHYYIYTLITIALLALSACQKQEHYRIGVSQCSQDDWRRKMNDEILREIMLHPEAEVEIRSADDSNDKQIADIRYFLDNDFDIIIAAPNEADAITPVIREAYEAGTPVIVFDRDINGDSYTAFQGADNYGIGQAAAQYALSLTGTGGKVVEIYGLAGSTPAIKRHEGFRDAAAGLGLNVLGIAHGNWNYDDAALAADSLLSAYPDADLVYAHNDRMAIAASEVAARKGLDLKVIGVDAAPEIGIQAVADSVIDATFLYPTEGHSLVRTALDILKGRPYERVKLLPVVSAVDHTNADILLLQNEALKEETSKIRLLKGQVDEYWDKHFTQTTLFYAAVVIVVLLIVLLFTLLRAFWQHKRHQRQLVEQNQLLAQQRDTEKRLKEQLEAATQSKLIFFTNVSHDLRTPLTLIAEPVEQLSAASYLTPQHAALMQIANKNVKILRRLINQILDFRKYENGKLQAHLSEVRIAELAREWAESFTAVARQRDIKLAVDITASHDATAAIDTEMIERVCFNLLSNAIKYTPAGGKIRFACDLSDSDITIAVSDTGQGIAEEDLGNIFDRFFQVDKVHPRGSGIGLSLAKAFVELHGGTIEAQSEVGKGSTFTVTIPVRHVSDQAQEAAPTMSQADIAAELADVAHEPSAAANDEEDADKPLLLVIDDNADIRQMIRELLSDSYRVSEAANGKEGIRLASRLVPDLIVCDVMMPVMDGLECCRRIKEEVTTSHIPVLMLTACSMDEQRIQGYESGADGYLSKPFDSRMLRKRCENLIANRKRITALLGAAPAPASRPASDAPATTPAGDIDSEFYARFAALVAEHMADADLSIHSIAAMMGIGRSQFYRKIKALTNFSPVELLRKMRLAKARELLAGTDRTVSEIAYEVGFSAPAYFTRVFREAFGESPTDMRARLGMQ